MVSAVKRQAPRARVLVVDYLTILPDTGAACFGVPLTTTQLDFERGVAARLKTATEQAAANTGATLIDAASASTTHHSCSAVPWVEKYVTAPLHAAYHSTPAGMTGVADLITGNLD